MCASEQAECVRSWVVSAAACGRLLYVGCRALWQRADTMDPLILVRGCGRVTRGRPEGKYTGSHNFLLPWHAPHVHDE